METFSASLAICAGNSPVTGEFPSQRPVTQSFDVFFDLRPNKLSGKQVIWYAIAPIMTSLKWLCLTALQAAAQQSASRTPAISNR